MTAPPLLLDVSRLIWRAWRGQLPTGIDRACLAYVVHYQGCACAVVQRGGLTHVMDRARSQRLFSLLLGAPHDLRRKLAALLGTSVVSRGVWQRRTRETLYLNIGHTGLDRAGHAQWIKRRKVRAVYFVHDLIPITHPEFARVREPERHVQRMRTVLDCAASVIVNSADSAQALANFAAQEGRAMPPALIAPLGIPDLRRAENAVPPLAAPYFVTLGTIEGRKNHKLLLKVWEQLALDLGGDAPRLVIIGQRGWAADDVFAMLDGNPALSDHIVELGRCDDATLANYLTHARALLFPSFAEGQGLPLAEALAVGTPVIASDLNVFHEMAGGIPDYIDPLDVARWREMILAYAAPDSPQRAAQLTRMAGFVPPSWNAHFATVDTWIESLDRSGAPS